MALAAAAGVSAWLSLGALAVTDASTRARIGALPPFWALALFVVVACAGAWVTRLPLSRAWPLALTLLLWLPWFPGRLPAAFLIWQGPVVWLVWTAAALGLLFGGEGARRTPRAFADPARAPWMAAALAATCAAIGAVLLDERLPTGDEPHYLVITQSLLLDGDLRIENNHQRGDYLAYYPTPLLPDFQQRGSNGEIYSIHSPGLSVLVLPAFAIGGYGGALVTVILLWAAAAGVLWRTAWRLTGNPAAAWVAWASLALTTPGFFHGFAIYPDTAGAFCTAIGMWLLVEIEAGKPKGLPPQDSPQDSSVGLAPQDPPDQSTVWGETFRFAQPTPLVLVACGAVFALMPWLHTRFALLAGVFGMAVALRWRLSPESLRQMVRLFAIPVVSAVLWLAYFWWIWGTPNPMVPYGRDPQTALRQAWPGLPGLFVDQQFGLVPNAPIYIAAVLGLVHMIRRHPRLAIEIALLVVPYAIAVASYRMWWGGLSAPARFLVPLLPAMALPVAWLWAHGSRAWRAGMLGLLLIGGGMVAMRLTVDQGVLLFNARDGYDLLLDRVNRSVNLPLAAPSLHRDVVGDALRDIGVWTLAIAVIAGLAAFAIGAARAGRAAAWTAMGWAGALAIMVSSTVVWARYGDAAVTPHSSALAWLQQWSPAWQTQGLQLRPVRLVPALDLPARLELASVDRGPRQPGAVPLFSAPFVPAGEYEVQIDGAQRPSGRLSVELGRVQQRLDEWDLDGRPPGLTGLTLRLPVLAHSITIRGDETARSAVSRLTLRPRAVRPPGAAAHAGYARRASRYGRVRVFFLDDDAFMEPPGFWTRGAADTTVVIDADPEAAKEGLTMRVRAGAVPATVLLSSGAWSSSLSLAANGMREVALPPLADGQDAWRLTLETSAGFRPGDHDPKSSDLRNLGVWVEF